MTALVEHNRLNVYLQILRKEEHTHTMPIYQIECCFVSCIVFKMCPKPRARATLFAPHFTASADAQINQV